MTIKRLGQSDLAALRKLNKLFAEVFEDEESYASKPPSDGYLREFLGNAANIVLVAEDEGRVVGGAVGYLLQKFEQKRSEVYLYDLAVAKDQQRKGVGTALMRRLRAVAAEAGAWVVFVQADEGDEAVEFYRALGPSEDLSTRNFDFLT